MADPTPEKDTEIQEILSDLDNILSDLSGGDPAGAEAIARAASNFQPPKPAPAPAKPAAPAQPPAVQPAAPPPPPVAAPPPVVQAPPPPVAQAPSPPAAAPALGPAAPSNGDDLKIELAPREGTLPGKKKEVAAPAPAPASAKPKAALPSHTPLEISLGDAAAAPAASAAAPTPAPSVPAPAPASKQPKAAPAPSAPHSEAPLTMPAAGSIPASTPKDQIRRVCIVHHDANAEQRDIFVAFLDQSALTISKKPIYLRKVVQEAFGPQGDPAGFVKRALAAKAVAVLALLDGLPEAKVQDLSDACSGAGLSFKAIANSEVQKRSVAVDIMVDMMLLPGEE